MARQRRAVHQHGRAGRPDREAGAAARRGQHLRLVERVHVQERRGRDRLGREEDVRAGLAGGEGPLVRVRGGPGEKKGKR